MNRRTARLAAAALATLVLASLTVASTTVARSELTEVRAATARFNSLHQAARAGYGQPPAPAPLHECISSFDGSGAMGFHYINGNLLDGVADPTHPEVLVYAPDSDGNLHLVALEYVIFQDAWFANHPAGTMPSLFGHDFMATGFPNRFDIPAFFSLHVWLWQSNPAGLFAPFNPTVSCDGASASATVASRSIDAVTASASVTRSATSSRRSICSMATATA